MGDVALSPMAARKLLDERDEACAELARVREELERTKGERDRWEQAARSRLDGSVIARAEKAEARLSWLESDEAVERAARVLNDRFLVASNNTRWDDLPDSERDRAKQAVVAVREALAALRSGRE